MVDRINPWTYVRVDPASVKDNHYIHPKVGDEGDGAGSGGGAGDVDDNPDVKFVDAKDFLILENIVCYGSDGKPFERYERLAVAKDVVREPGGRPVRLPLYNAILHFEQAGNGWFSPSYALQCAVIVALFQASVRKKKDGNFAIIKPGLEKVLQQYKYDWMNSSNTIVDGKNGRIIHYPSKEDFPECGGTVDINVGRRIEREFSKRMNRDDSRLEDVLKNATKLKYTQDLTGLKNPSVLIDIADYSDCVTKVSFPSNRVGAAWFGYGLLHLDITASSTLGYKCAARWVCRL